MGKTSRYSAGSPARRAAVGLAAACCAVLLSACGSTGPRQDQNEPKGDFTVDVVKSQFPIRQRIAERTDLRLAVRNTGDKTIPNLAITISTDEKTAATGSFNTRQKQANLSDPNRPVWVLENGYPKLTGHSGPAGAATSYTNTFAFGALEPGKSVSAIWRVTAVKAGTHTVSYRISAGLTGRARATLADQSPATGKFVVTISSKPPQATVDNNGRVVTHK